jgi:septal ring factor EnvC (AmiA/AmiB activator)
MKQDVLIFAAFVLCSMNLGYPASVAIPQPQKLGEIQSQLKQANQNIEQIKLKREKLVSQLQNLEKQIGASAGSLRELNLQIGGKEQRIKELNTEMQHWQNLLSVQNNELAKQVKAAFVMGKKEQLHLLLNQQDPSLTSRMLVYYDYLNKSRIKQLVLLKNSIAHLQQIEQEKHSETDSLEQVVSLHKSTQQGLNQSQMQREQLLTTLKQDFDRQLMELDADEKQTQALIDNLLEREKQETLNPAINKYAANNLDIDGNPIILSLPTTNINTNTLFDNSVKKPFSQSKGHLPWPIQGSIIKQFGSPRSETRWDGVLISAKEGTDIRAVSNGRVVFADWLKGYGWLIIINHGDGYMTLYAFNQTVYKKVGEQVQAGMIIGAVGSSGGREESGLYFGIRNNGKPVNPANWCKKA